MSQAATSTTGESAAGVTYSDVAPHLQDSLLMQALSGKVTARPPVWFMRQAGRYLPEYQKLRSKHTMLEAIRTPEVAAEITLQPIRRFEMDGAIIFADILNPLIGMGMELDFVKGSGPRLYNPLRTAESVDQLQLPEVVDNVGYTLEAIRIVADELAASKTPLFGFCGAPFTLSSYMIEGAGSQKLHRTREFMYSLPDAWHELQNKLVAMLTEYLVAQVRAGVSAVQIFDSWLGFLSPADYTDFVEPYLKRLIAAVREQVQVPIVFFSTGTASLFQRFPDLQPDVLGVDWRMTISQALEWSEGKFPLQGNLDPLLAIHGGERMRRAVSDIVAESKKVPGFVFNVGHGLQPQTPPEHVAEIVKLVKESL